MHPVTLIPRQPHPSTYSPVQFLPTLGFQPPVYTHVHRPSQVRLATRPITSQAVRTRRIEHALGIDMASHGQRSGIKARAPKSLVGNGRNDDWWKHTSYFYGQINNIETVTTKYPLSSLPTNSTEERIAVIVAEDFAVDAIIFPRRVCINRVMHSICFHKKLA